jgi:uncharacterized protein (DUF2236 family)
MEHSAFVEDPFGRVYRSIPQIWATILRDDGDARARRIRDLHRDIKGTDDAGARYHALDAETFWWAHATFTWEMLRSIQLFHRRQLTVVEREAFYAETVEWYGRYGVSMRPVPSDFVAFAARFRDVCDKELELTPAAAYAVEIARSGRLGLPLVPDWVTTALRPGLRPAGRALAFGCLPTRLRERMAIPWTAGDRRSLLVLRRVVQTGGTVVPSSVNQSALRFSLRQIGSRTRDERYQLTAR